VLGLPSPRYAHAPLLLDADGARLAKRRGDATLAALRAGGAHPRRIVGALAATLGWLTAPEAIAPSALLERVDATRWPTAATRWGPDLDAWLRTP